MGSKNNLELVNSQARSLIGLGLAGYYIDVTVFIQCAEQVVLEYCGKYALKFMLCKPSSPRCDAKDTLGLMLRKTCFDS